MAANGVSRNGQTGHDAKPNGTSPRRQAQWSELRPKKSPLSKSVQFESKDFAHANGIKHEIPQVNGHHNTTTSRSGPNPPGKKKLILNAFVEMCSGHQSPGLWRHPSDQSSNFNDLAHWTSLAQLLERGHFHGIFIADVLGGYDVYGGPQNLLPAIRSGAQWPVNEPLSVVPAMAAATKSIGFGVTVSTSYEQPYHLARRLSTLDHLTKGRVGWNVVTGKAEFSAQEE